VCVRRFRWTTKRLYRESTERSRFTGNLDRALRTTKRLYRESTERAVRYPVSLRDRHGPLNGSTERALKAENEKRGQDRQHQGPLNGSTERALKGGSRALLWRGPGWGMWTTKRLYRESTERRRTTRSTTSAPTRTTKRLYRESTESPEAAPTRCRRRRTTKRLYRESTERPVPYPISGRMLRRTTKRLYRESTESADLGGELLAALRGPLNGSTERALKGQAGHPLLGQVAEDH